ncbi:type I-F CRISPR-associated protein Csy2 [Pseudomonas cichorii]|uniref:type I-F CRISPR-associated protein Csy2 n=1 Tax=Pseudomonas cichorii TaxID=36746 RepID=UPI00191008B5|nr:type I-F CRISPR-associated protein Csy2 [Pseudomonas cichorii]GFM86145.1 type I-F CRISPR-associated protein Csy2 [Pseudomonas cichorii]
MADCPSFTHLLVIPRIRVQNANSISSPLTHGFPSMTAFLGLMWALERKTHDAGLELKFKAVGVVVHHHEEQTTDSKYVSALRLTRNPVNKDGSTAAIVEEGRMHMEISLVFGVQGDTLPTDSEAAQLIARQVRDQLSQMRIAGGSVVPSSAPPYKQQPFLALMPKEESDRQDLFSKIRLRLLPGFALVDRQDLLEKRHDALKENDPDASSLDAWLSLSRINWHSVANQDQDKKPEWVNDKKGEGWIVPIPVGYGALSDVLAAGSVANARDGQTEFCFVESLYGIGEWISPHRLHKPEHLLWYADSQPNDGLYRCANDYRPVVLHDFD